MLSTRWRFWLFISAFFVAVPLPAILVICGRREEVWTLVLAGVSGMLLTRLDDLKSFALGPLKAEMESQIAKAKVATDRANATVDQLRRLALALSRPTLATALTTPRFNRGPSLSQYEGRDEIVTSLRDLGASEAEIEASLTPWRRGAEMDHQDAIYSAVRGAFGSDTTKNSAVSSFGTELNKRRDLVSAGFPVPASDFSALIAAAGLNAPGVIEAIDDLAHFQRSGSPRRPSVFPGR